MNPNDLPLWLLGIQAVTWLGTGDAALAARAVPNSTASKLHGHPDAIPVEGWKALSQRIKDERRGVLRQYLEYTGSRPRWVRKEPLSADQRAQLAGEPSEWHGGFSLTNLAIRTGSWPEPHIKRLVEAVRAGHVRTIDPVGNTIGPEVWRRHWLREAIYRPGVLIMVPDPFVATDEDTAVEPLFNRDDVLRLVVLPETLTETGGVRQGDPEVDGRAAGIGVLATADDATAAAKSVSVVLPAAEPATPKPRPRKAGAKPRVMKPVMDYLMKTYPQGIPDNLSTDALVAELKQAKIPTSNRTVDRARTKIAERGL